MGRRARSSTGGSRNTAYCEIDARPVRVECAIPHLLIPSQQPPLQLCRIVMIQRPAYVCGRDEEANLVLLAPLYLRDQVLKTGFLVMVQVSMRNGKSLSRSDFNSNFCNGVG